MGQYAQGQNQESPAKGKPEETVNTVIEDLFSMSTEFDNLAGEFSAHTDRLAGSRPTPIQSQTKEGKIGDQNVLARLKMLRLQFQEIRFCLNESSQRLNAQI